jgi:serine/threonine protein kinase
MPQVEELDQYVLLQLIGRGAFGTVFRAKRKSDNHLLAIKILTDLSRSSKVEHSILQQIAHPFIVAGQGSFVAKRKMHICMELVQGGSLYERMITRGPIPLSEAKIYVAEIAMALTCLHDRGIVYRDLKPENVMLDLTGHVKLTDFGLATEADRSSRICGTPDYIAPEALAKKPYGKEVDWWALGILFFEMLFRRTPFYAVDRERMKDKILHRPVVVPGRGGDGNVSSLISGLLEKDPKFRFGYEDIVSHALMEDLDFFTLGEKKEKMAYIPEEFDPEKLRGKKDARGKRSSFQSGEATIGHLSWPLPARSSVNVGRRDTGLKSA